MLEAIIFDMDGTLFQTNKILELSLEDAFQHFTELGKWNDITPLEKYRQIMGVPLPRVWETLLPNHSVQDRDLIDKYFLESLIDNIDNGRGELYPNTIEILTYLKDQNYSIYIASNGLTKYLNSIVKYYKLDTWIAETFSIESIETLNKSDLVKKILLENDINHAVVVGDRLSDIQAAKDNNLVAIGCKFDFAKEEELNQSDFVVNDLLDLKFILEKF